jgi:hypothetical protein
MSMPKEWTDKIKAQEQQKKLEADNIHNLPKEFEHRMNVLLGISPRASVCVKKVKKSVSRQIFLRENLLHEIR